MEAQSLLHLAPGGEEKKKKKKGLNQFPCLFIPWFEVCKCLLWV